MFVIVVLAVKGPEPRKVWQLKGEGPKRSEDKLAPPPDPPKT
jgi:hypothetical protein